MRTDEQLAAWDEELARTGQVEIGYGARSVVYLGSLCVVFVVLGVFISAGGDRVMGVAIATFFGGLGLAVLAVHLLRPGAPMVVDHEGVHVRKPRAFDVPWDTVRNAYVLRSQQGPTVALVVVQPDGTTTSVELGRVIGGDRKTLAAWLATKARAA